jgi:hypothetical protein
LNRELSRGSLIVTEKNGANDLTIFDGELGRGNATAVFKNEELTVRCACHEANECDETGKDA